MNRLITLTTDFGLKDAFVGVMKGVILGINPAARIVDISHSVEPQNIREGAFVLASAFPYFPPDTVHLAVVDPGVGTNRRPVAVATPRGFFVAPDNALLTYVLDELDDKDVRAIHLTEPRFWLPKVSTTFHGRDIFAPVAAHLSLGVPIEELGEPAAALETFPVSKPEKLGSGTLVAHVIYVDRFGNLITDAKPADLPPSPFIVSIKGHIIFGLSTSYAGGNALVALIDSSGRLEIALKDGNAARELGVGVGEEVRIEAIEQTA